MKITRFEPEFLEIIGSLNDKRVTNNHIVSCQKYIYDIELFADINQDLKI